MGLEFDPLTGEPAAWNLPEPATVTWYQEATAYAVMKWPSLAAHSRAGLADALATVTPVLTWPDARNRPDPRELRTVFYQHAFNPARLAEPGSAIEQILDWAQQASVSIGCLSEPAVLRTALEALTFRLDGSRAAASTVIRKRAVLHGALGYAAEAGLLPDNPLDSIGWRVPQSSAALDPAVVASPAQVSALLDAVARIQPELTAFFGCLYNAALRPEEAVALRFADCCLPGSGWGMPRLAAATPRTASAWTNSGTSHEQRGLKHRPDGAIRMVPVPPVLVAMLCAHSTAYGTAPDGRLFRGTRGGPLSESVYGRAWHSARALALGPELAASGLARRPYDLRHAALSLWLNAGGDPAQIAARAGNSVAVLLTMYSHCIRGHDDLLNQQIGHVLEPPAGWPGLLIVGADLLLMRGITADSSWTHLIRGFLVAGAGSGIVNPPLASTAVGAVAPHNAGMAFGANNTLRQIGISTSVAAFGTIFTAQTATTTPPAWPVTTPPHSTRSS